MTQLPSWKHFPASFLGGYIYIYTHTYIYMYIIYIYIYIYISYLYIYIYHISTWEASSSLGGGFWQVTWSGIKAFKLMDGEISGFLGPWHARPFDWWWKVAPFMRWRSLEIIKKWELCMVLFMVLMVQKNLNALNSKRWNPVFETKKPSSRNASGPKKKCHFGEVKWCFKPLEFEALDFSTTPCGSSMTTEISAALSYPKSTSYI